MGATTSGSAATWRASSSRAGRPPKKASTDKTIVSKAFTDYAGQRLRILSKVVDGAEGLQFADVKGEAVLRVTAAGRYEIKATILVSLCLGSAETLLGAHPSQGRPITHAPGA